MAITVMSTSDALRKTAWEERLFRNTKADAYFPKFFGNDEDSIVHVKNKLTNKEGDKITFGLINDLDEENYRTSSQTVEGNEQALSWYDDSVTLEEYVLSVRVKGKFSLDEKRAFFSINDQAEKKLQKAGAKFIDFICRTRVQASPTKIFYGDGTSTSTITAAGKITPALLTKVDTWCGTGGNQSQPIIKPVMVDGKPYRVMLVHDDVAWDLNNDSTFNQARREAEVRGKENPIFSGAYMIYGGVVVHKHPKIDVVTNWGSGADVPGCKCVMLGAQSLIWAWGVRPRVVHESFDYGREQGYAWSIVAECKKPVFNSKDYGSAALYVARTQISDA